MSYQHSGCQPPALWLRLGLVAVSVAAYAPLWGNDFIDLDDEALITWQPRVRDGLSAGGIAWALGNDEPPYRMPVTRVTFQVDAELSRWLAPGGTELLPAVFHGQNLAWHVASVLLLFGLAEQAVGGRLAAAGAAGLFALHPMHVESVAWAAERKDVLMAFFGLVAVRAYVRYARTGRPLAYVVMNLALLASLLAKPMLLTFPALLALLDGWPLGRLTTAPRGRLVLEKLPPLGLALGVAILTMESRSGVPLSELTLVDRLMNALAAYRWYVVATCIPTDLAVLYPHPRGAWDGWAAAGGAALLVLVAVGALSQARRRPWLAVGWLWFVVSLSPVVGLAQGGGQAWADRFSYWPHVGLFLAVAAAGGEVAARSRGAVVVHAVAGLGALALLTHAQVGFWKDSVTLWERAAAVTRDNARAHLHLSIAHRRAGREAEAERRLREHERIQLKRLRAPPAR